MKKLFINLSNHPSSTWSDKQKDAAAKLGEIVDIPFPVVDPNAHKGAVEVQAIELLNTVLETIAHHGVDASYTTVCIAGEFSLVIAFVMQCEDLGMPFDVVVATSERNTTLNEDGSKTVRFDFVQFRLVL